MLFPNPSQDLREQMKEESRIVTQAALTLLPVAALRAAKIAMMKQKRWSAAYYWAAFELQVEWR